MLHDAVENLQAKDFLTLANASSGFLAIFYAMSSNPTAAVVFVVISGIFDYFDGKVARETKPDEFGKQLDSLSDMVSFGAAPAAIVLSTSFNSFYLIFAICYVCAGAIRLAAFNLQKESGVYYGLPIPLAAFMIIGPYYFFQPLAPFMLLLGAVFMLLKVKIHKPKF